MLEAAMGHLGDEGDVRVDPDAPEVQTPADPHRAAVIPGEDAGSEAVLDAVCPLHRLILVRERLDGDDGAEDLGLRRLVVMPQAGDDGGGVEVPPLSDPAPAGHDLGVAGKPLHHAGDMLELVWV